MSAPAKPDTTNLSPEEQRLFRMYGKLPIAKRLTGRKYFDSGDYALAKAGNSNVTVGTAHPTLPRSNQPAPSGLHHSTSPLNAANATHRVGSLAASAATVVAGPGVGAVPARSPLASSGLASSSMAAPTDAPADVTAVSAGAAIVESARLQRDEAGQAGDAVVGESPGRARRDDTQS